MKYVVITSHGQLPTLGGISGPIQNPIKLNEQQIYQLLTTQKKVFEVESPNMKNKKVELTLFNYNKNNFPYEIHPVVIPPTPIEPKSDIVDKSPVTSIITNTDLDKSEQDNNNSENIEDKIDINEISTETIIEKPVVVEGTSNDNAQGEKESSEVKEVLKSEKTPKSEEAPKDGLTKVITPSKKPQQNNQSQKKYNTYSKNNNQKKK